MNQGFGILMNAGDANATHYFEVTVQEDCSLLSFVATDSEAVAKRLAHSEVARAPKGSWFGPQPSSRGEEWGVRDAEGRYILVRWGALPGHA
jgi:hypothetical protein